MDKLNGSDFFLKRCAYITNNQLIEKTQPFSAVSRNSRIFSHIFRLNSRKLRRGTKKPDFRQVPIITLY
jgi:hypothetical protein